MRLPDAVLLGRPETGVEREHLGVGQLSRAQRIGGVVDLALAGQEDQDVAVALRGEFVAGVENRVDLIRVLAGFAVSDLDGVRPAGDGHDRCGLAVGVGEVGGESVGVDGGRRDDHLQVGALRQELFQVPEDEVDVEAPLVGLVDDQGVVAAQHPVALDLGEQDAVGHHPDLRAIGDAIGEADGIAHRVAELATEFFGDAFGDRARSHTARLGVADHTADATSGLETQLGDLRALARPGLSRDDHDLVGADDLEQFFSARRDREIRRILHLHMMPTLRVGSAACSTSTE